MAMAMATTPIRCRTGGQAMRPAHLRRAPRAGLPGLARQAGAQSARDHPDVARHRRWRSRCRWGSAFSSPTPRRDRRFANAVDLSVYFKRGIDRQGGAARAKRAQRPGVARVVVISADRALAEFRAVFGIRRGPRCAATPIPLPHVLHVHPPADAESRGRSRFAAALFRARGRRSTSCRSIRSGSCASMRFSKCCGGSARHCGRDSRGRRHRGDRQYHPARDPQSARRDRGDEARRRLERLRAPAVSLHRILYGLGGALWRRRSSKRQCRCWHLSWRHSHSSTAAVTRCRDLRDRRSPCSLVVAWRWDGWGRGSPPIVTYAASNPAREAPGFG